MKCIVAIFKIIIVFGLLYCILYFSDKCALKCDDHREQDNACSDCVCKNSWGGRDCRKSFAL